MASITLTTNVSLMENTNQDFNLYNVLSQAGMTAPPPISALLIQVKNSSGVWVTAPVGTYVGLDLDAGLGKETLHIAMTSMPTFTGNQDLRLVITDGANPSDLITLYVTVHVLPVPPVAQADAQVILQDTVASGNVLDNDSDPKGLTLTVTGFTVAGQILDAGASAVIPDVGTLTIAANGDYSFTPVPGYVGPVPPVTYTITDGTASTTADLNLMVMPGAPDIVNQAPVAQPDTAITDEDQAISGNVLNNDSDADSPVLTVTEFVVAGVTYPAGSTVDIPGQGSLILNADGSYTFTPAANWAGTVPVAHYSITDGNGGTAASTLSINVTPVNDLPVANPDSATTPEDTAVAGNVLGNDSDVDGGPLTVTGFTIDGQSQTYQAGDTATIAGVGTLAINADGSYTFTPAANWAGTVPIANYSVTDGNGGTAASTLSINVTPSIDNTGIHIVKLVEGIYSTGTGGEGLTPGYWKNHTPDTYGSASEWYKTGYSPTDSFNTVFGVDIPGNPTLLTALSTGGGDLIALMRQATAALLSTSDPNISYLYSKAEVISLTQEAIVTGQYEGVKNLFDTQNNLEADLSTPASASTTIITPMADANTPADSVTVPVNGEARFTYLVTNTGTAPLANVQVTDSVVSNVTYVSGDSNMNGLLDVGETWTYTDFQVVSATGLQLSTATVTAVNTNTGQSASDSDVAYINTVGLTANADSQTIAANTTATGNVLANDSNPDGGTLSVTSFMVNGVTYVAGSTATLTGVGTLTINTDGSYSFNPAAGYTGNVPVVSYTISDGQASTASANLNINVTGSAYGGMNHAPDAVNDSVTTTEDVAVSGNVLGNDNDADGDNISVTGFSINGQNYAAGASAVIAGVGTLSIAANGSYNFAPAANYSGFVPIASYSISDGGGGKDTATLSINVTPVNDGPDAQNDSATTAMNTAVTGKVLANDTDVDGDSLTVTGFSVNGHNYAPGSTATLAGVGTLMIKSDGSYSFKPAAGYSGAVPMASYTISDGHGGTDTATLSISVTPKNTAPVAHDDTASATAGHALVGDVLSNDTDANRDHLVVTRYTIAGHTYAADSTATLSGVGSLTLHADGSYSFTPVSGYTGAVPVATYSISDGRGGNDTATLTIRVSKSACSGSTSGSGPGDHHESDGKGGSGSKGSEDRHESDGNGSACASDDSEDHHESSDNNASSCQGGSDSHQESGNTGGSPYGSGSSDQGGYSCGGESNAWSAFCQSDSESWGSGHWSSNPSACTSGTQESNTPAQGDMLHQDDSLDRLLGGAATSACASTLSQPGCGNLEALKALASLAEQHQPAAHA